MTDSPANYSAARDAHSDDRVDFPRLNWTETDPFEGDSA